MSAEATIARHAPGQLRIVLGEGGGGLALFLAFVLAVTIAVYFLVPAARERLPRRVNTLSEADQASMAALLAENLGIPLQSAREVGRPQRA